MGKIIDFLYDYNFNKKYKNPYTDAVGKDIYRSILYTMLNSNKIQENEQKQDMIKKVRGF